MKDCIEIGGKRYILKPITVVVKIDDLGPVKERVLVLEEVPYDSYGAEK